MRFLQKDKISKSVIVVSDLHLGAGAYIGKKRNYLEAFHHDEEFIDFLDYFSTGDYQNREVDLIINGDFLDLLAVPFVKFFDDDFWSEEAALAKLEIIIDAHKEVIASLGDFLEKKNKHIYYIIGNHDAEMIFPSLRERLKKALPEKVRTSFSITSNESGEFSPIPGVIIKHGHEYEKAHQFRPSKSLISDENDRKYFLPPWGSYFVIRVLNKYKEIRPHVDAVKPIKRFLINGFIYDTFFTVRFLIAIISYFFMVRFVHYFWLDKNLKRLLKNVKNEVELFKDYETITQEVLEERDDVKVLVVGHTHHPTFRSFVNGSIFINTGTWTRVWNLGFGKRVDGVQLCFAQIDIREGNDQERIDSALHVWKGRHNLPFECH
ncbi:MAG: metallophosphoesterase [Bacteriovoracaceae bacterium]|nr:metallophosphoesterase [Bacteriovoracaceae bacterium]